MSDKNYVNIQGNVTRDAELKYLGSGMAICKFSVAVNEGKKKPDGTWENIPSYFDVVCFAKLAERVAPVAVKGKRLDISGHLKQDRWESSDGKTQSRVNIIADDISIASILGSSSGASGGKPASNSSDFPEECPF